MRLSVEFFESYLWKGLLRWSDVEFLLTSKLVSQLELLGEKLSQEDVNQKLLKSLSPEWNTHVVLWRNKDDLETMSMYDLYNNLKVYELEVKGMSSSHSSTQNMAFVSSLNNSSTNEVVDTTNDVSTASTQVNAAFFTNIENLSEAVICTFLASQPNSPQLAHEDLEQIHPDDMEEIDLRWQMAMLTIRARRSVPMETPTSTALVSCDGLGGYDLSDQAEEGPNYALMAYTSLSFDSKIFLQKDMDSDTAHMMAVSKVLMLKPENGLTLLKTQVVEGVATLMPITSVENKAQRRLEVKARSTLMMGIPNEHQSKSNSIKDAKQLMEAIEKRYGQNAATKKTQRNLLKQQYENFTASNSEMLDQPFDRI
uniref:Uncharacterized protein n=1 Tax=Tanacetum cinerariifolium TaxID=118510 RepID=A0A6L2KNC4_TANCI|nr:hypothetical protein [Tanacetum cinerariifolium]